MVRHPWNSFSACSWLEAKRCPSSLICELTCPIFTAPDRLGQALQTAAWPNHLLVGGLEHCFFPYIGNVIIPTDFHIFQRGRYTTNQLRFQGCWSCWRWYLHIYIFVLLLNPRLGESIGHIFFGGGLKQIQVLIGKQRASARAIARNPAWKSAGSLRKYHGYRYRLIGCFVGFEKYLWVCYALDCSDNDGSNWIVYVSGDGVRVHMEHVPFWGFQTSPMVFGRDLVLWCSILPRFVFFKIFCKHSLRVLLLGNEKTYGFSCAFDGNPG